MVLQIRRHQWQRVFSIYRICAYDAYHLLKVDSLGIRENPKISRNDSMLSIRLRSEVTVGILKKCLDKQERTLPLQGLR